MALIRLNKQQCIENLQGYANTTVRSWNPFKLFRKRKLSDHGVATEILQILKQEIVADDDLLRIARAIDGLKNTQIQEDLLSFLYSKCTDTQNSFLGKRKNVEEVRGILLALMNKTYRPWWTLFLFDRPYFSEDFRDKLNWLHQTFHNLFAQRRTETKIYLKKAYANEAIAFQIASEYTTLGNAATGQEDELKKIIDISLKQTQDETKDRLLEEIKETLKTNVPFGRVLISAAGLTSIINTYLSKEENKAKPRKEQAQEILYIIGNVFLKIHATQTIASFVGMEDMVKAVVSVVSSKSSTNPLRTERKVATAFASITGGAIGATLGSIVPGFGTSVGAFVGTVVGKTAVARFYEVVEAWQKAPRGSTSIVPSYTYSRVAIFDNDRTNILQPIYDQYSQTERMFKQLGDEIAKWLSIYYTLTKNSDEPVSAEYLEIIEEEMKRLRFEFVQLKDRHGKTVLQLSQHEKMDNKPRVEGYLKSVKPCLMRLQKPIIGMLNEYFPSNKIGSPANPYASPEMERASSEECIASSPVSLTAATERESDEGTDELSYSDGMHSPAMSSY